MAKFYPITRDLRERAETELENLRRALGVEAPYDDLIAALDAADEKTKTTKKKKSSGG